LRIRGVRRNKSASNVSVLSDATANLRVSHKLDVIWTSQNYHDLHDTFMGPADGDPVVYKFRKPE
jgi:predicted methyltransferase